MSSKKHIKKAIENIEDDRQITRELLDDAIKWLSVDDARHQTIGMVLAKYVETLQRSNEQLVKIISIQSKKTESDFQLTESDRENLFDMIQEESNKGEN